MKERILTFFLQAEDLSIFSFQCGYLMGVLASVLILLLLMLLGFLLRLPSKAPGVEIQSENGTIFISANAIKDLVRKVGEEFPCFQVLRVGLFLKKKELFLRLELNGASGKEDMEENMEEDAGKDPGKEEVAISLMEESLALQEAVLKALLARFGIDSIKKVYINMRRGSFQ